MSKLVTNPRYAAQLVRKELVCPDTYLFCFKTVKHLRFTPGQYVWVILSPLVKADAAGERRAMSIVNTPNAANEIEILVRISDSGYKQTLSRMKLGDHVSLEGPFGFTFIAPRDEATPLVLLAGGVGLAPFMSLALQANQAQSQRHIELVTVNESNTHAPLRKEIDELATKHLHVTELIGKLTARRIKKIANTPRAVFYIAGPQGFVDQAHKVLRDLGVPEKRMRFEHYFPTTSDIAKLHAFFDESGALRSMRGENTSSQRRRNILRLAIESTSHHIIITDTNGEVVFANQAAMNITGYSFGEMKGNTPRLWGGLMGRQFYRDLWSSKLGGKTVDSELINRRKDGTLYHVLAHIAPILTETGDILGFIGTEEDITAIRESEHKTKQQEERFEQLVDRIPEVYWITSLEPEEKILYVSPAVQSVWGVSPERILKDPNLWLKRIHPDDQSRVQAAYKSFIDQQAPYNVQYRVRKNSSQEYWVQDVGELVLDEKGKPLRAVGVARNITRERSIDQEKTEFVSLASHQLKTPISAVNWSAEMLLGGDYGKLQPRQKAVVEDMYQMNLRMRDLVNSLLNISRIDMGTIIIEPEPTDFAAECRSVLTELGPRITSRKQHMTTSFAEHPDKIMADPKLLRIILQNFLVNAINYTPVGGKLGVDISYDNQNVTIQVTNNGEPIPKADQSKIFSKMFRASNAQDQNPDGNGLGLYLVKTIVDNGGGKVWFDSGKGKPTTFTVSFPLTGMKARSGSRKLA